MLETNYWVKMSELDTFENGCDPKTTQLCDGYDRVTATTSDEMIQKLLTFCGEDDRDAVLLDSCGEIGRVDIQTLENGDGYKATKHEIESWKAGQLALYACTYTFYVESVTRSPFSFEN